MKSFNILVSIVVSIGLMDEWRSLILLLINAFLRLYHVLHIYSTNAGELIKKFDSLINESISTEINNIFELLTLDSSLFYFLVFGTISLVDVKKAETNYYIFE